MTNPENSLVLDCAGKALILDRPRIMGILNVTPDSFSDGGRHQTINSAIRAALTMEADGADIIDVGGESTRPGAEPVSVDEELARVIPVIEQLSKQLRIPISIDTSKARVMRAAVDAGAGFINDVSAFTGEGATAAAVECRVPLCAMHRSGTPGVMQQRTDYDDVVGDVRNYLTARRNHLLDAGVPRHQITLDPGIGFGKTLEQNIALINGIDELQKIGQPLLFGISRKSMLGAITGQSVGERLHASVTAASIAAMRGVQLLRVHDVGPTVEALSIVRALDTD